MLKRDKAQFDAQAIAQAQVDADAADLKSKRALAAQQQANIDKKTIRAPFSGKLGITTVNPGQYVNPGDKIVTLQTIDPVYVDFNLPQKQIGSLQVGQVVNVTSDGFAGVVLPRQDHRHQPEGGHDHAQRRRRGHAVQFRSASCCPACSPTRASKWATRSTT